MAIFTSIALAVGAYAVSRSGKPKSGDYAATEQENTLASVAQADYNDYKKKYSPLLKQMRDESESYDPGGMLRGRGNATAAQALRGSDTGYSGRFDAQRTGGREGALQGQYTQANADALNFRSKSQTNVLGVARNVQADTLSGLGLAATRANSVHLNREVNRQRVGMAKRNALVAVGAQAAEEYTGEKPNVVGSIIKHAKGASSTGEATVIPKNVPGGAS